MLVIKKKHILLLLNMFGLISGLFVPMNASVFGKKRPSFKLPKRDTAAAQAFAELKRDFAEQQKIMLRMRASIVEQYVQYGRQHVEFSKEQIVQNQYAALKELNSIDVEVCDDHLNICYEIYPCVPVLKKNSPTEFSQELLARPYGALILPMTIALRGSVIKFVIKHIVWSSPENRLCYKSIKLDENGNTADLFFDIAFVKIRSKGPHTFVCRATIPLNKTQQQAIAIQKTECREAAQKYVQENHDAFVASE